MSVNKLVVPVKTGTAGLIDASSRPEASGPRSSRGRREGRK